MTAKTTKRALEILGDALEMAADERSALIERRCGGNEELRREVLAQLEYHSDATITPPSLDSLPMPELPARRDFASRYELGDEIARGGVGRIIRAMDHELRRTVAIKVLLDRHKNNPELVRRFIAEARISGKLTHPGITPVYEVGVLPEGDPYIAMKLVKGRTLSSLLEKRASVRDDPPRFLAVFENVCQTVAYAHSRGVIHRDLKPENVMVSSFGEVQVMDWGLAKMVSDERDDEDGEVRSDPGDDAPDDAGNATRVGAIMGTPAYMPPEQAMGLVGPQNDVFALGGILCEILTGSPPYPARSSTLQLQQATQGDILEARDRLERSGADKELVQLAVECLKTEAEKRPADADEVARQMGDYGKSIRERARKAEIAGERARVVALEQRKRSRMLIAGSFLGFIVVLGVTIVHFRQKARYAEDVVAVEKLEREKADDTGYWAMMLAAFREFNTGHYYPARVILESAPPNHRNWEWRHLWNRINSSGWEHTVPGKRIEFAIVGKGGSQMVLIDVSSGARIVDLESNAIVKGIPAPEGLPLGASNDGSHFLSVTGSSDSVAGRPSGTAGELVLWETLTGKTVQTFPAAPGDIHRFRRNQQSVSLQGKHVACISPDDWGRIILYRTSDARPLRSFPIEFGCTFSPDGEWFIYSTAGDIRFWDISGEREARPPIPETSRILRCSPDRSRLAGVRHDDIVIWNLTTGARVTLQMETVQFPDGSALFSADGKEFVAAFGDGSIRVWNPDSGELLRQFEANQEVPAKFGAYSWNDGCLAVPTHLDDGSHIKLVDLTPDPHRILRGHSSYVYPVAISSDGRTIISGSWDKTVRIWEGDTGKNLFTCHGHDSYLHDLSLNDPNRRVVSVDLESTVCLWDSTTGGLLASRKFPLPEGFVRTVKHIAFTPDGKTIIGTSDALLFKLNPSTLGIEFQAPLQEMMGTCEILDLKVSPSGKHLGLIAKDRDNSAVLRILDTESLDAFQSIRPAGAIREFEFSPDESSIAIGFEDGSVGIWEFFPGADQPRWIKTMHHKSVLALKFTPDGSRLFSGGTDAEIRIWDTKNGTAFGPMIGHSNYVYSLAISGDGKRLVSGSGDGTVRVWDTTPRRSRFHRMNGPESERE